MKTRSLVMGLGVVLAAGLIAGCSKAQKAQRQLARANADLQAGAYDKAEIEYLNVLRLDRSNRVAIESLGRILHEQGRTLEALRVLTLAKAWDTNNLAVRVRLGQSMLGVGGFKQAREEAVFVLGHSATNDDALVLLADSSVATNDLRDAQQRLEKLRPLAASRPGFHLAWGALRLRDRDLTNAETSFKQALALSTNSSAAHAALASILILKKDLKAAEVELKLASDLAPLRSVQRLRYAEFKAGTGDAAGARQLLEDLRKQAPDYLPALVRLAELELVERKFDASDALLKEALRRDPMNLEALTLSPRLSVARGDAEQAVTGLEKLIKLNPKNARVHYQLALAALMKNDQAKAMSSLAQAVALAPDYAEAVLLQAELNVRRGNAVTAVASLTKFTQKFPGLLQGQLLLASAERARGNLEEALAVYRNLARNYPTNPQPFFLAAMVQREQGKTVEARNSFEQALRVAPDFSAATVQLVDLDLAERKFDAAFKRAETYSQRNPKSPQPLLLLAQVYAARTNLTQVEATLLKAVEMAPDFTPGQSQLARFYVATGRQAEALKRLQSVVAVATNDLMSWMQIGVLQTAATNYTAARDAYEKILAFNSRYAPALNNLAWLYSEYLNDLNRAYEFARKASDLQPNEPAAADTLGWILFKRGDYAHALTVLQESARKLPNEPEVQYHLGMAHYMLGEEAPATLAFKTAMQLSADFPGREDAKRRLGLLAINAANANAAQAAELERMLKQDPHDPILLARAAAAYQHIGATDKAVDAYELALQRNPNSVPLMVKLAQFYSTRSDKQDDALKLARKAHDLAPDDATVSHTLATLAMDSGDHKWALSLLEECARKLSADPQVLYDLGMARYSVGLVDSAAEAMRTAQRLKPSGNLANAVADFLSLKDLLASSQPAEASLTKVREALKTQSNNVPALMVLSAAEARKGNAAGAARLCEQALSVFPAFTPAMRELAVLQFGPLKNFAKAYEYAQKVRETDRADVTIAKILAITAYERGEFTRAADLLTECTRKRADDAEAFYYLGLTRQKLKQVKECKEALNKALALQPNGGFAADAKRVLAELK